MTESRSTVATRWQWVVRLVALLSLVAVGWVSFTAWSPVVHGHPAYPVLLALTVLGALAALWRARRPRARPGAWRLVGRGLLLVLAVGWVAAMVWLRPFAAVQPALAAMRSDASVEVTESATRIVLAPAAGTASEVGVFFQPGARVDARAYAAVLRPLAEAGHPVVIAKQPLGIAFLALPAFDAARSAQPQVQRWVLGGHSLGGTVAAIQADAADADPVRPGGRPPALRVVPRRRRARLAHHGGRSRCRAPRTASPRRPGSRPRAPTCPPTRRSPSSTVPRTRSSGRTAPSPATASRPSRDEQARTLISAGEPALRRLPRPLTAP